jgi:tetratricopeptide (TPR) repeat protein
MPRALPVLVWLVASLASLAGCTSTPQVETQAVTERQSLLRSARLAFTRAQYALAASLYQRALVKAMAEDDPVAIIDARFNLALSQTYLGHYHQALAQVSLAEAERSRRNLGPDRELQLLEATIHYRAGDLDVAHAAVVRLLAEPGLNAASTAHACFIAGLIAADRNDAAALRAQLAALDAIGSHSNEADRLELQGRLAAIEGRSGKAQHIMDQAIALRRLEGDYHGMVRVLASAGDLAESEGELALAGGYLLRAGRSGLQRDAPEARGWLERARTLGERSGDASLVLEANSILREQMSRSDAN